MPAIVWATAGTATVELTILEKPAEGHVTKSSILRIPGCFIKNDKNLQHFVEKSIPDSADRNKFDPANCKYIFYSPVKDFKGTVTKAVISYEKISKKRFSNIYEQNTLPCTVEDPLIITFDGHFFLCCDSKDLNRSKFLKKHSKEVTINQRLDPNKKFYGLGRQKYLSKYLQFIPFNISHCQSQKDIYETSDRRDFMELIEAGPLLLHDKKTVVGCYRKSDGKYRIKINVFGKSQGDSSPALKRDRRPPTKPPRSPTLRRDQISTLRPPGPDGDRTHTRPPPGPTGDGTPTLLPPGLPGENRKLVPLEITFRGPEAEKAYREALKNGEVEVYLGRIMLIGQDRAGKTSLKKSLLGLSFDPNEQSTNGVVVDPSTFRVDVDNAVDWKLSETRDVNNSYEDQVASVMAKLLNLQVDNQEMKKDEKEDKEYGKEDWKEDGKEDEKEEKKDKKEDKEGNEDLKEEKKDEKEDKEGNEGNEDLKEEKKDQKGDKENEKEDEEGNEGNEDGREEKKEEKEDKEDGTMKSSDTFAPQKSSAVHRISEEVIDVPKECSADDHHVVEGSHDTLEKSKEENKEDVMETEGRKDVIPETVMKKLIERLSARNLDSSEGQETTISIWDFAGQQLYYASHPVFFSHRAIYVLVYNLEKDLLAEAEPCVRQGVHEIRLDNHDQQTNLDALLSWLVSVHSARPESADGGKNLPYLRPPVIIVGTHADCPFEDPKKMEEFIQKHLAKNSCTQHVVRPFITVDNRKSSDDEGVKKLKEEVKKLFGMEPYMGEKVPVRWFKFEQVIKSLVEEEGKNHMSLKDLERVILEVCDIEDKEEVSVLLNFYHDLGVIVKHRNTVVLKAEWLIDLFRKLITIRPFNEQNPVNSGYWRKLEGTGILDVKLVEHVFKEQIGCGETKDDILAMMEHYGLIARFVEGNEPRSSCHYFVPALLNSSPEAFCDVGPRSSDPCTLYLHFLDGFIPHGLYNCLVSRLITWCSEKGYPHKPKLYHGVSKFRIGLTYRYKLFLLRRKRFVKVVLRSLQAERAYVFQPVAFKIREALESFFKEMREECLWYQSLSYEICVRCPSTHATKCEKHQLESCIDDDCLHLLPIEKDRELVCSKSIGEEAKPKVLGLEEWYREHPIVPIHSVEGSIGRLSVSTFKLADDQKRWLVVGICLNKVLLPALRNFIEPEMESLYTHLKTIHSIDTQSYHGHLKREGKCNSLNYGSINSNETNHPKKRRDYDYGVNSAVDLAKLYLKPFMAKFSDTS